MNGGRLSGDFTQESSFDLKIGTCCFSNWVLFNVTAAGVGPTINKNQKYFSLSGYQSAETLILIFGFYKKGKRGKKDFETEFVVLLNQ